MLNYFVGGMKYLSLDFLLLNYFLGGIKYLSLY